MENKKVQKIGQAAGIKWGNLKTDPEELKKGIEAEAEHKDITKGDKITQAKIANAHLKEDPQYYTKLEKMESSPKINKKKERNLILIHLVKGL